MGMTDEEKFRFDLNGYLLREAILTPDEIAEIKDRRAHAARSAVAGTARARRARRCFATPH